MGNWKDILAKLVDKVNKPFLAFIILFVIVVALLGKYVPTVFQALVYILAFAAILRGCLKSQARANRRSMSLIIAT